MDPTWQLYVEGCIRSTGASASDGTLSVAQTGQCAVVDMMLHSPMRHTPMETELEKIETAALKLTPGERAALAQRLLASLEQDAEIEEAWAVEVERRIAEVESGAVQLIPMEEALARVRGALK